MIFTPGLPQLVEAGVGLELVPRDRSGVRGAAAILLERDHAVLVGDALGAGVGVAVGVGVGVGVDVGVNVNIAVTVTVRVGIAVAIGRCVTRSAGLDHENRRGRDEQESEKGMKSHNAIILHILCRTGVRRWEGKTAARRHKLSQEGGEGRQPVRGGL